MCLSPHEMTVEQLEDRIARMKAIIDNPDSSPGYRDYYVARLENYEKLLKEKADTGQMV